MAARAPHLPAVDPRDEALAAVLAAVKRAPLVPLTDHERSLLAEVRSQPGTWSSTEDFLRA